MLGKSSGQKPHHYCCCCFHIPLPSEQSCVPGKSPSALQSPLSAAGALAVTLGWAALLGGSAQVSVVWRESAQGQNPAPGCSLKGLWHLAGTWFDAEAMASVSASAFLHQTLASPSTPVPLVLALPALGPETGKGWEGASETTQSIFATLRGEESPPRKAAPCSCFLCPKFSV